ncbi:MAG: hypothetical protein QM482_07015 [Sulfurospirillum sp.]
MNKILFLFFILFSIFSSAANQKVWEYQYSFNLKKDKIATVLVDKQANSKKNSKRYILKFRWTLYANKNLILLSEYMKHPNQYVMKRIRSLDKVRIKLLQSESDYGNAPYALIIFSGFDEKKRVATLDVYIKDRKKRVQVVFKAPQ